MANNRINTALAIPLRSIVIRLCGALAKTDCFLLIQGMV